MKKLLLALLLFSFFISCSEKKGILAALSSVGIPGTAAEFRYSYTTPGGVSVQSTQEIPPRVLDIIDTSINLQITRISLARPTWNNHISLSNYSVLLIDPTAYSQIDLPGAPLIQLPGGTTAGTVIGIHGTRKTVDLSYIVVPHQNGQNWRFLEFFSQAVYNESEHDRECNEPSRLAPYQECDQFSGWNDVHPHFP